MKKPLLALAGCVAALALLAGLATAFPFAAIFLRVGLDSLTPQAIGWEAKNAWSKCDGAIGGTVDWPSQARPGLCRHAYVRQRSHPDVRATRFADIGRPPPARLRRSVEVARVGRRIAIGRTR